MAGAFAVASAVVYVVRGDGAATVAVPKRLPGGVVQPDQLHVALVASTAAPDTSSTTANSTDGGTLPPSGPEADTGGTLPPTVAPTPEATATAAAASAGAGGATPKRRADGGAASAAADTSIAPKPSAATAAPKAKPTTTVAKPKPTTAAAPPTTKAAPKPPTTKAPAPAPTAPPATEPPPPPTTAAPPAPAGGSWTPDAVKALIQQMWPADSVDKALRVAWRESNYRPEVYNGWCCYGVFQINASAHRARLAAHGWTVHDLYDPQVNITIALEIFNEQGWGPWGA